MVIGNPPYVRQELLGVHGIGPETADSILLYALGRRVVVVDAYTRRLLVRHELVAAGISYRTLAERIVVVPGDDRTLIVPGDDRTLIIGR